MDYDAYCPQLWRVKGPLTETYAMKMFFWENVSYDFMRLTDQELIRIGSEHPGVIQELY